MRELPDTPGNLQTALAAAEKGLVAVPCAPGTKVPCVKWKEWQTRMPPEEMLRQWFADPRRNVALICNGVVDFDCDDPAKAELVIAECGDTPEKVRTPRGGVHLVYRRRKGTVVQNQVKIKGMAIDIRTDGGLRLIPPSRTADGAYEWLGEGLHRISELPLAKIGWTRERTRKRVVRAVEQVDDADFMVRRARAYVATIEGAVSGRRGHDRTFRVACVLARKFSLSFEQAWPILLEWNETCEPPWSEPELRHKLEDALGKA